MAGNGVEIDRSRVIAVTQAPQPVAEPSHVVLGQTTPAIGQQVQAQERCRLAGRQDDRLARVQR